MSRLDTSNADVKDAILQILSAKPGSIEWAVFGYEAKSNNKIKVDEKGSGWDDLLEEVNEGKVQFFYQRSEVGGLQKYVLIGHCGEGSAGSFKGTYQNHYKDFESFVKSLKAPIHYNLNARNEKDFDQKKILEKLKGAMGANYDAGQKQQGLGGGGVASTKEGVQVQVQAAQTAAQVVTSSSRALPTVDERNKFWTNTNTDKPTQVKTATAIDEEARKKFWEQQQKDLAENKNKQQVKTATAIDEEQRKKYWEQQQQEQANQQQQQQQKDNTGSSLGARNLKSQFEAKAAEQTQQPAKPAPSAAKKWAPTPAAQPAQPAKPLVSGPPKTAPPPGTVSSSTSSYTPPPVPSKPSGPPPSSSSSAPSGGPPPVPGKPPGSTPPGPPSGGPPSGGPPPVPGKPPVSGPPPVPEKPSNPLPPPEPAYEPQTYDAPAAEEDADAIGEIGGLEMPSFDDNNNDQGGFDDFGSIPTMPAFNEFDNNDYSGEAGLSIGSLSLGGDVGGEYPVVTALYDFAKEQETDLEFKAGDQITVLDKTDPSGWWRGRDAYGNEGVFPMNFVQ
eukprot:TRINITY_DN1_c0_g1_i1.p1 TRINITY_DN1_c0_g1~~TRINITY_DN1_c0_g1_i1.p1  ORF type:complete len:557 (-),score=237.15 TRINITY_DN1_c0_g1_i1:22-1692(-)